MGRFVSFLTMTSLVFVISCGSKDISASYPFLENSDDDSSVTILFSDEHDIDSEHNYYEALLNFQQEHPDKLTDVNVVSENDKDLVNYYEVESFPTLIVINELEVLLRIEGAQDFRSIYSKLKTNLVGAFEQAS